MSLLVGRLKNQAARTSRSEALLLPWHTGLCLHWQTTNRHSCAHKLQFLRYEETFHSFPAHLHFLVYRSFVMKISPFFIIRTSGALVVIAVQAVSSPSTQSTPLLCMEAYKSIALTHYRNACRHECHFVSDVSNVKSVCSENNVSSVISACSLWGGATSISDGISLLIGLL